MNRQLLALGLVGVALASFYAAEAYNAADSGTRAVTATVVGDSAAYLGLAGRAAGPFNKFVTEDATTGLVAVSFGSASGITGTGVNPKSIYYFDDILQLTNQGNDTIYVQVVASAVSPSALKVCYQASVGGATCATNSAYATTMPTTATSLTVGSTGYIGLGVDSSAITSKATGINSGTIRVYACRTATASCSSG